MHWGHAVSSDLVHWKELPIALYPDKLGTMFSGSAVVDRFNSSGLGTKKNPPVVAFYTAAGEPFTQCLAYSLDGGMTLQKLPSNPILKHIIGGNRDPKVVWHEGSKQWVMALYLDGDEFAFFGSSDLKSWKELSRSRLPGSSECPDLFPLGEKWVFFGANYRYLVGSFDGKTFKPEHEPIQGDFGHHFYASQTYSDAPRGRRIQIAWMNGGNLPGMPFTNQMSFPCELRLVRLGEGWRVLRMPVKEISSLVSSSSVVSSFGELTQGDLLDIEASFAVGAEGAVEFDIRGASVSYDASSAKLAALGSETPLKPENGVVKLRILVDRSSVEVFGNDGLVSLTSYFTPPADRLGSSVRVVKGMPKIKKLVVRKLKSLFE
jgi:levanase/fructan beta-fructosidase